MKEKKITIDIPTIGVILIECTQKIKFFSLILNVTMG